jgi:hypothetical protein
MLFSIWVSVLLFRLLHVFGKMFALTRYPGYPWESQQSIGSFIGYAVLALVTGRRYLAQIWRHLTGRQRLDESGEMVSYRGAVLMVLGSLALLVGWGLWTKVGWTASLAYFGFILICGITASKIRAEAGPFFAYWFPYFSLGFVSALGGFAIFNTTGMLVMAICAGFMGTSCFLYLSPVQLEMMELGRHFQVRLKDMHAGLWIGLAGGLFIGGFILLCWGYGFGADGLNSNYPFNQQWYLRGYFATTEQEADRIFLDHSLLTPDKRPLDIIHNLDARGIAIGMGVTWLLGLLRAFFTWFPLHPLGYVLATSYFSSMVFTIFVAWVIRQLVQRIAGVHGIRRGLVPFAVGMFLGCIATIILFDGASLILRAQGLTNIYNNCWP